MVDHRADRDIGITFSLNETLGRVGILGRASHWFSGRERTAFEKREDVAHGASGEIARWLGAHRIALAVSIIWFCTVAAYAVGFVGQFGVGDDAPRAMRTLDLLFLSFAAFGPVAMIWLVALMLDRTSRLADAIGGQSDTALALAATISNLQESLDAQSSGTIERLESACDRMEREISQSTDTLDRALTGTAGKLDAALLDSVIMLDSNFRDRLNRAEKLLADQNAKTATRLADDATALIESIRQRSDAVTAVQMRAASKIENDLVATGDQLEHSLAACIERVADGLTALTQDQREALSVSMSLQKRAIETVSEDLSREIGETGERQRSALSSARAEHQKVTHGLMTELSAALETAVAQQKNRLEEADVLQRRAIDALANDLLGAVKESLVSVNDEMRTANAKLAQETRIASRTVSDDVTPSLKALRVELEEIRKSLSVNPPAAAKDLADLLGDAAKGMISPERAALAQALGRIEALEQRAETLIERIDRSSRLTELAGTVAQATAEQQETLIDIPSAGAQLFDDTPTTLSGQELNWTAVVHYFAGFETPPAMQRLVDQVAADTDIQQLTAIRSKILGAVAEDGLFADDLVPAHAPADVWASFATDKQDSRLIMLAGVGDDVSEAIMRGWMRRRNENRELGLRYVRLYKKVLTRAAHDLGADDRLVELAETSAGRLFMLIGGLSGVFTSRQT